MFVQGLFIWLNSDGNNSNYYCLAPNATDNGSNNAATKAVL